VSEWVDFGLYALQAVLLWIVLPAWAVRILQPSAARIDDADTPAAKRGGGGWVLALRAWGVLSVLALLAYRLDKVPPPFSAASLQRSEPEVLLMTSNLLLALGLLVAGYGLWRFTQWLREGAQPPVEAQTETFPPTRDDFLPRWRQYLAYALLLCALVARPAAGLLGPGGTRGIWGNFFMSLLVALLLLFAAAGSAIRSPNRLDAVLGERYRWREVNLCYLLMTTLALLEIAGVALDLAGEASRRHVALLVSAFVSITLLGLMLLPSRPRPPLQAQFDDPQ